MNTILKKTISILLMAGMLITVAALALPTGEVTAAASPITASCSTTTQSGTPGSTLHYAVTIANGDAVNNASITSLDLSSARGLTTPTVASSISTIGTNSNATVIVDVPIPSTAVAGQDDIITLSIYEDGTFATSISLTVIVVAPGAGSNRPLLVVNSYNWGDKTPKAGSEFQLAFVIENRGQISAYNYQVSFSGTGFFPRGAGGTDYIHNIEPGGKFTTYQTFMIGEDMAWTDVGSITATVGYTDPSGKDYTATFPVSIKLTSPYTGPAATATPKNSIRPQLVITGNSADIDPLQPGSIFELTLNVKNLGTTDAKNVIMVLGGGATTTNDLGTPQPGTSGSGADLTNFAPLGSSNIVVVGDIPQGASVSIRQKLVVNVSTVPGAYTLKTSFSYVDDKGTRYVDDQVITMLVYSLPQVEISFYRDPGMLTTGMPNMLPIQVTNLGRKSAVLGNMKVTSNGAEISNGVALVGALDPGGCFTLDAEAMPMTEGPLEIEVTINYTDDFNQERFITQTLTLDVMAMPTMSPEEQAALEEQIPVEPETDTFWSKVGRFFLGLFGLDSGEQQPAVPLGGEEMPVDESVPSIVVPKG